MAGEKTRDVDGISTIPLGVDATGTLTQDTAVAGVLKGTGTQFRTEFEKARLFLFFPNLSPPLMLKVKSFNAKDYGSNANGNPPTLQGEDIVYVENPPALGTIAGEDFQIISATLREFGLLNKGDGDARFDGVIGGATGTTLPVGQTEQFRLVSQTQNSTNEPKDAHWVDATGTLVEIYEQP